VIWVYAGCERPDLRLPRVRGLACAPLDTIAEGPLVAVLSRHAQAPDEPLPMRFGTRPRSADSVAAVCASDARPPAADRGSEHLRARLADARGAAGAARGARRGRAVAVRCWPERAPGELLRTSYLVDKPAVTRFRSAVESVQREHPEAALLCGPWPAYSFVEGVSG
jgi:hypothetical protein